MGPKGLHVLGVAVCILHTLSMRIEDTGRCQFQCAEDFALKKSRLLNDGSNVDEPLLNSTAYIMCKIGCFGFEGFEDVNDASFTRGKQFNQRLNATATNAVESATVLQSIELLCLESSLSNSSNFFNATVQLTVNGTEKKMYNYFVEAVVGWTREDDVKVERSLLSVHTFSTFVNFAFELPEKHTVQFRGFAIDASGRIGEKVNSRWWKASEMENAQHTNIQFAVRKQMWLEEQAALLLSFHWPINQAPICVLSLSYENDAGEGNDLSFRLDESRAFLLPHLHFSTAYRVVLDGEESSSAVDVLTRDCLDMAAHRSFCPPVPVQSLVWRWNSSSSAVVSWEHEGDPSVHFALTIHSLFTPGYPECETAGIVRRNVMGHTRSVSLRFSLPHCDFSAELVVVDSRNRRSRPVLVTHVHSDGLVASNSRAARVEMALVWSGALLIAVLLVGAILLILRRRKNRRLRGNSSFNRKHHEQIIESVWKGEGTMSRARERYVIRPCQDEKGILCQSEEIRDGIWRERIHDGYATCDVNEESEADFSRASLPSPLRFIDGLPLFSTSSFIEEDCVGRGRFGVVVRIRFPSGLCAALKKHREPSDFDRELTAIRQLAIGSNPYLISLLAVAAEPAEQVPIGLIYEYAAGGDLHSLLVRAKKELPMRSSRSARNLVSRLIVFCRSVALALNELSLHSFVHRDVSTRNVLLMCPSPDPFSMTSSQFVKLADFGLARPIYGEREEKRILNVPWQAPEVRNGEVYTDASEVWSFGCLLCEVMSFGEDPWPVLLKEDDPSAVRAYISTLTSGVTKVDGVLAVLVPLLEKCFSFAPSSRPPMSSLVNELSRLMPSPDASLYVSQDSEYV